MSTSQEKFKALGNRFRSGYKYGNENLVGGSGGGGGGGTDEIPLPNGSTGAPSLNFQNALSSGLYLKQVSPPIVGVVVNGSDSTSFTPDAVVTGQVYADNGTTATPSHSFQNMTNGGLYLKSVGPPELAIAVDGSDSMTFGPTQVKANQYLVNPGTVAEPSIVWSDAPGNDTGFNKVAGLDIIQTVINGAQVSGVSASELGHSVMIVAPQFQVLDDGTASAPAITNANYQTTGLFFPTTDTMAVSTGGTQRLTVNTTGVTSTLPLIIPLGSAASPSIQPTSDSNSGIFSPGADQIAVATNGVQRLSVGTTSIDTAVQVRVGGGSSPAAPNYTFSIDNASGMYTNGVGAIGFATSGTARMIINTTVNPTVPVLLTDGTASAPSLGFQNSTGAGLFRGGTNIIGFTTAGSQKMTLDTAALTMTGSTQFIGINGSATAPSIRLTGDSQTGLFRSGTNVLGITTNGTERLSIGTANILSTLPLNLPAGTNTAPAFSFSGSANSGMFMSGADLGFSVGGSNKLTLNSSNIVSTSTMSLPNATAASPTYSFTGQNNLGMFCVGTNQLGFSTSATQRLAISTTAITSTLPLLTNDGTNSAPAHSFSSSASTGMFRTASILGFSHNGTTQLSLDTSNNRVSVNSQLEVGSNIKVNSNVANKNTLVSDGSGVFTAQPLMIDDLGDVVITSLATGHVLQYNGTNWVNKRVSAQTAAVVGGNLYYAEATVATNSTTDNPPRLHTTLSDLVVLPDASKFTSGPNCTWTLTAAGTLTFSMELRGSISGAATGTYRLRKNGTDISSTAIPSGTHFITISLSNTGIIGDVYTLEIQTSSTRTLTTDTTSFMSVSYAP